MKEKQDLTINLGDTFGSWIKGIFSITAVLSMVLLAFFGWSFLQLAHKNGFRLWGFFDVNGTTSPSSVSEASQKPNHGASVPSPQEVTIAEDANGVAVTIHDPRTPTPKEDTLAHKGTQGHNTPPPDDVQRSKKVEVGNTPHTQMDRTTMDLGTYNTKVARLKTLERTFNKWSMGLWAEESREDVAWEMCQIIDAIRHDAKTYRNSPLVGYKNAGLEFEKWEKMYDLLREIANK